VGGTGTIGGPGTSDRHEHGCERQQRDGLAFGQQTSVRSWRDASATMRPE
jgi:hypothetical protein